MKPQLAAGFKIILTRLHNKYDWFTLPTPRHSILNHELFWVYCFIETKKPQLLFESGLYKGRSTVILAEMMRPHGSVIAAHFRYEDDPELHPFANDYDNLSIVSGKGEDVAKTLPNESPLIAVIDGPKPGGSNWGRPGWKELVNNLMANPHLLGVFQHDISNLKPRQEFVAEAQKYPAFEMGYITTESLQYDFFDEIGSNYSPNLGYLLSLSLGPDYFQHTCVNSVECLKH